MLTTPAWHAHTLTEDAAHWLAQVATNIGIGGHVSVLHLPPMHDVASHRPSGVHAQPGEPGVQPPTVQTRPAPKK
jgi:hypothetical protein